MTTLRVFLTAFVITGITACGQTGALYLPNKQPPANQTVPDNLTGDVSSQSR